MHQLKPYAAPIAFGFVWGTLGFILYGFTLAPPQHSIEAFQQLAVWSIAGALTACAIAFVWDVVTQRVRQREDERRKIRIATGGH